MPLYVITLYVRVWNADHVSDSQYVILSSNEFKLIKL